MLTLKLKQVKSNTVLMMAMAMPIAALAPMATASSAMANGVFGNSRVAQTQPVLFNQMRIAAGAVLPLSTEKNEKITLTPTETKRFTLMIPQNLRSRNGTLLVAAGSKVEGEFRPVGSGISAGTQFVAQTLITSDGKRYAVDGVSPVITRREKIRQGVSTGAILKGAGAGAGAAAVLGAITGDKKITVGEVLTGAVVGAAGGAAIGRNEVEVIAIYPSQDLSLRLNQSLALNY
jgi:phage tail tape-measure protein